MGTVVKLKNQINDSYFQLKNSVEDKLVLTEEKIKSKLASDVDLVEKMTNYHIETGGKRLRALLTLGSAKLCGYTKGSRDINLAACVELIHSATLMHDDVIDEGVVRRGKGRYGTMPPPGGGMNPAMGGMSALGEAAMSTAFALMMLDFSSMEGAIMSIVMLGTALPSVIASFQY